MTEWIEGRDEVHHMDEGQLAQAQRILARRECLMHGHDWDILNAGAEPVALICSRCGESRKVSRDDA